MEEVQKTNGVQEEVKPVPPKEEPKPETLSREDLLFLAIQEERLKTAQEALKASQMALEIARLKVTAKYKLGEADAVDMTTGTITRK